MFEQTSKNRRRECVVFEMVMESVTERATSDLRMSIFNNLTRVMYSWPGQQIADAGDGTLYILYSGWDWTIYIAGMGVVVARDAVRPLSL